MRPKELKDVAIRQQRRSFLDHAHIAPLTAFVEGLRGERGLTAEIPFFDPLDGGTNARCLCVAEAPGPRAVQSGFISRDNPDESAKNTFLAHAEAGLPREHVILWNIVPWYIGDGERIRAATSRDVREGLRHLLELLALLPTLQAVALVGRKAQRVRVDIARSFPELRIFDVPHPSPQFVNRDPSNWRKLVEKWRDVADSLGSPDGSPDPELHSHLRNGGTASVPPNMTGIWTAAAGDLDSRSMTELVALVRDRGIVMPPDAGREAIIAALRALPDPIRSNSKYAGKRIVRAKPYQAGGNPRQTGSHGYNAYELIPVGDYGVRYEDLLARIKSLPAPASGGSNHVQWDLDHGHTYLIDDGADQEASEIAAPDQPERRRGERGRPYDSGKTRVAPVFAAVALTGSDWVRRLLRLPHGGSAGVKVPLELRLEAKAEDCFWGDNERALNPPIALLSWLVRNLPVPPDKGDRSEAADRRWRLAAGDPEAITEALRRLRADPSPRGWHVLEGQTYPDAFIETPDALLVVEGKRTEAGPTTSTTWMPIRHQMLRHLDAAWEIRGRRRVFGFFIVEAEEATGAVPKAWLAAAQETIAPAVVAASLPHRSPEERQGITEAFLGVTTWQAVCSAFGIDPDILPDRVPRTA